MFFLASVIYFMFNSSWVHYKFLEDVTEFFSWQAYGLKEISRRWKKIQKRFELGAESELKLAIIEADDFLSEMLEDRGYEGKTFEELAEKAGRALLPNLDEILKAHEMRNSIVYNPDYKLKTQEVEKALMAYEVAVKNIGAA